MLWLEFFISAGLIVFAGIKLTHYADILSDRLQLGKVWVGVVLLGLVTSLPEAFTSMASVLWVGSVDLAVGNIVGSNNFNPFLLVLMDMLFRKGSVTDSMNYSRSHRLTAGYAAGLMFLVILGLSPLGRILPGLGPVGVESPLIILFYFWGMKRLASFEKGSIETKTSAERDIPLRHVYVQLAFRALLVILGAVWLAGTADRIALATGLGQTFVGVMFLGLVTSLPEMVVTVSALKLGALDLALGNIFGSNMTNIFVFAVCDLFYVKGPILRGVSRGQLVPAVASLLMVAIALIGIRLKGKKILLGLGWDSWLLTMVFVFNVYLLYFVK